MPPKAKFTKEELVEAALTLVQAQGADALTARALGTTLGCSTRPIFTVFQNMQQLQQAVLTAADARYQACLREEMQSGRWPPYKASGHGYIRFAREQPELFRLLFMRDRSGEAIPEGPDEQVQPIVELVKQATGLGDEEAWLFHVEMWIFVHGIATMIVTGFLNWESDAIDRVLSDAYAGLCARFVQGGPNDERN